MSFPVSGNHVDYLFERIDAFLTARKNDVAQLYTATGEVDFDALNDIKIISNALVRLDMTFNDVESNLTLPWKYCDKCSDAFYSFVSKLREDDYK